MWRIIPMVSAVLILAALGPVPAHVEAAVIFQDSFNGSVDDAWYLAGNWEANDLGQLAGSGDGWISAGDPGCADYTVRFELFTGSANAFRVSAMSSRLPATRHPPAGECTREFSVGFYTDGGLLCFPPAPARVDVDICGQYFEYPVSTGPNIDHSRWYTIEFGIVDGFVVFRYWPLGGPAPNWYAQIPLDPSQWPNQEVITTGYWYFSHASPCLPSDVSSVLVDNFVVQGHGAVPTQVTQWGALKSSFR